MGSSGSILSGTAASKTATAGSNASILGLNWAMSNSTDSGATVVGVTDGGQGVSGTKTSSGATTAMGTNNASSGTSGQTAIGVVGSGMGGAATEGMGETKIDEFGASSLTKSTSGTNMEIINGAGESGTTSNGGSSVNFGGSNGTSTTMGATTVKITGNGTGSASTVGGTGIMINAPMNTMRREETEPIAAPAEPISLPVEPAAMPEPIVATPEPEPLPFYARNWTAAWWWDFIPKHFWVDIKSNWGRNFVAFKALNGRYLACNCDGKLTSTSAVQDRVNFSQMWIPERLENSVIALRSYYGGYMSIYDNGRVDCSARVLGHAQKFEAASTGGANNEMVHGEDLKYLTLKGNKNMYLGVDKSNIVKALEKWEPYAGNQFTGPISKKTIETNLEKESYWSVDPNL
jgi:hypothetical protein